MRFGSVCSGIEAASIAWEVFGWKAAWFAEVDKAASQVLAYRFPDVPNLGDMTKLAAMVLAREIAAPDILVGGTPCQDFSIAGLRAGLAGERGQLTLAFIILANAIDEVRRADGLPPCIIVWENVPGVLNHKDNPLGCFLAGVAGEDLPLVPPGGKWTNAGAVLGPQRAVAWRVLDAQFFGLAQRRRRVFVVASAREGFDPAAILLEFEGVRRDSAPRREAGEGVAGTLDARTEGGGFPGTDGACCGHVVPASWDDGQRLEGQSDLEGLPAGRVLDPARVTATLDASYGKLQGCSGQDANHGHSHQVAVAFGGNNQSGPIDVATACNAHGGPHGRLDFESETFVDHERLTPICFSSKDYGADAMRDLSPAIAFYPTNREPADGNCVDFCPTLTAGNGPVPGIAYSVALRGREGGATAELGDEVAGCLRASTGGGDKPHVLAPVCVTGDITHTLKADGFDAREDGTGRGQSVVPADLRVRRLMPPECERLQGFPDGHTRVPIRHYAQRKITKNRPADVWEPAAQGGWWLMAADGPRYKQCGNSMATKVMSWIGGRIVRHLETLEPNDEFAELLGHNGGPPLDPFEALVA
jgi:DNA (cytosine-5)-methyltransferase 1